MLFVLSDRRGRDDPDQGLVARDRVLGRPAWVALPAALAEGERMGAALR